MKCLSGGLAMLDIPLEVFAQLLSGKQMRITAERFENSTLVERDKDRVLLEELIRESELVSVIVVPEFRVIRCLLRHPKFLKPHPGCQVSSLRYYSPFRLKILEDGPESETAKKE